ncbi:hypothetical protein QAD02_020271 [Eretmocerus hayati]|uniref:Uncharacterized protein n=1 Tax=Eretmocerus hayati TaxID=131215 RepID=A0ACC2PMG0_9HYME|nr:hypothetical protein QAD02_020271 [Eretmocerus hayati]
MWKSVYRPSCVNVVMCLFKCAVVGGELALMWTSVIAILETSIIRPCLHLRTIRWIAIHEERTYRKHGSISAQTSAVAGILGDDAGQGMPASGVPEAGLVPRREPGGRGPPRIRVSLLRALAARPGPDFLQTRNGSALCAKLAGFGP